jgi:hypothetical protein
MEAAAEPSGGTLHAIPAAAVLAGRKPQRLQSRPDTTRCSRAAAAAACEETVYTSLSNPNL